MQAGDQTVVCVIYACYLSNLVGIMRGSDR